MIDTLLIANRGEIACRIIRTARRLGVRTVAVYSDADAGAQHVLQADVALRLGPAPAVDSYLRIEAVLEAARISGAAAVHPGYGFLSENADFAEACEQAGLIFVGPSAAAIRAMGSKIEAKRLVEEAGAPVVPGYHGDDQSDRRLIAEADEIGFPLLIKASAGGGGKGMRRVASAAEMPTALAGARREAASAFGDERLLLERYLASPKHLEVQVLGDGQGNLLHLLERDCSVQRRHQKVIEEAPGPTVTPALRAALGAAAVRAAGAVDYRGAGTVEFIAEGDVFYFMEMNTRLQVEHPVTEAITGLDLVEWQLRIAAGERLPLSQQDIACRGHAIEARVYAENPRRRFLPSTGRLVRVAFSEQVRVDSGVVSGDTVGVHYDPMLAKVIAHGADRREALALLDRALAGSELAGVEHNVAFLRRVLAHEAFQSGAYSTHVIDDAGAALLPPRHPGGLVCAALTARRRARGNGRWGVADGFRVNQAAAFVVELQQDKTTRTVRLAADTVSIDGVTADLQLLADDGEQLRLRLDGEVVTARVVTAGESIFVMRDGDTERFTLPRLDVGALAQAAAGGERVVAPMPGQVIAVAVKPGDAVESGQLLLVIEAMKMEHTVAAPRAGTVAAVACAVGDRVEDGVELVILES
ncbi:MAG: acetyl/propionyl/methylcrotonyl-CoA carboxylase subunit alpha [Pseudomonadales bacterium]